MRKTFLFVLILGSMLLSACSNFVVTPDSNQSTNNGIDAGRVK